MTQLCLGPWQYSDSSLDCHWHFEYFRDDIFSFLSDFSYFPQNVFFTKVTEHDQNRSTIDLLKGEVDGFSYFSIDCQLFYFLTRIIPVISCVKSVALPKEILLATEIVIFRSPAGNFHQKKITSFVPVLKVHPRFLPGSVLLDL